MCIEYYENGNKKSEFNYVNGVKHGKQTEWYENGEKKSDWSFVDGIFRGAWIGQCDKG